MYPYLVLLLVVPVITGPLPEELEFQGKIPNCRDGEKPLLAAGIGIYTCDKKCPKGFRCEYKTTDATAKKGICCPNLNDLYRIYGEDDKNTNKSAETTER